MKIDHRVLVVCSRGRTELSDITPMVRDAVRASPVADGVVMVSALHTTCALFVNEFQSALMDDLRSFLEGLVPERGGYRHDDPRVSDCERGNAHAHLRVAILGQSAAVALNDGELTLGRFQSLIFAELDGPRRREISIQIIGN